MSHQMSLDKCTLVQKSHQTVLNECRCVQMNVDESLNESRRMQASVDKCRQVQTNVNKSKKAFFQYQGRLPKMDIFQFATDFSLKNMNEKMCQILCSYMILLFKFCLYTRRRYSWNEVDKRKKYFCLNQLITLFHIDLEEISQLSKMEKRKNL